MPVEVLFLHGSPGSGKTTLARAVSEQLRLADAAHAVIDLDDLSKVHPYPGRHFPIANLRAIWPNFAAIPDIRVIIPGVLADTGEAAALRAATAGSRFIVCELTAPVAVLKARVTAREPNDYWGERLRAFVDLYHGRDDHPSLRDFQVSTDDRALDETAREVIAKAGWSEIG